MLAPQAKPEGPLALPTDPTHLDSPRVKQVLLAQAEAEKIRKIGEAEAAVIEAMGKAEAERMKLKAQAYQKYGDSAKMALVLEALPQVRLPPQAGTSWANAGTSLDLVGSTGTGWLEELNGGVFNRGQEPCNRHPDYGFQVRTSQAVWGLDEIEKGGRDPGQDRWTESESTKLFSRPTS